MTYNRFTGFFVMFVLVFAILINSSYFYKGNGQVPFKDRNFSVNDNRPTLFDSHLKVEVVVEGLDTPTTMAFLGTDDFLVLEKDKGTVLRVTDGKISEKPLLDVNVANSVERCMCGIAVSKNDSATYVFLYYTEIDGKDGDDRGGKEPVGNRVYRYEFIDNRLVNPVLLLDLPAKPGPRHNGGAIEIGPDNNIYIPIGDIDASFRKPNPPTKVQNFEHGIPADGRSGILRITQDGKPVGEGILGNSKPLKLYFAYGIRNSFGLGFDPVTGNLWDTENGPDQGDEINLVYPGFNSGWHDIYGLSSSQKTFDLDKLVTFNGKGTYSEPKLSWARSAGLTSLIFLNSEKLGMKYKNDVFVSDVHNGRIYHFKLNKDRTDLALDKSLSGRIVQGSVSLEANKMVFGKQFGGITDMTVGPDGYLYVVSIGQGKVFRIQPK